MKLLTNTFILLYIISALSWTLPHPNALQVRINNLMRPIMVWAGLWQSWDMFAPDPLRINIHVEYKIGFSDGREYVGTFPQLHRLDLFERISQERFRKWQENIRLDNNQIAWNDIAQWIVRDYEARLSPALASGSTIRRVELIRRWGEIPAPADPLPPAPRNFIWGHRFGAARGEATRDKFFVFHSLEIPGSEP